MDGLRLYRKHRDVRSTPIGIVFDTLSIHQASPVEVAKLAIVVCQTYLLGRTKMHVKQQITEY
jgi:hypothetical protein